MKTVAIVLKDISSADLLGLLQSHDVWVVNSPKNDASIDVVWAARESDKFVGGLTSFAPIGKSLGEQLENVLGLVDEHYDEYRSEVHVVVSAGRMALRRLGMA